MAPTIVSPPSLTTDRLRLVALSTAHSEGMFQLWSDAQVCRFAGKASDSDGNPVHLPARDRSDSDKILNFWLRACQTGWGFRWAVLDKASGEFFGAAGFNSLSACAEYAYHLHPAVWGRGLMNEASVAAMHWLRAHTACASVEAFIEADNYRSIRLAERLGFRQTPAAVHGARRFLLTLADASQ